MSKRDPKKTMLEKQLKEDAGIIPWQRGIEPPTVYANHAQVLSNPMDFTLRFGQLDFEGDSLQAREVMRVFVSPPHFKALSNLLARQVARYEEQFGEILDLAKPLSPPPEGQEEAVEPESVR